MATNVPAPTLGDRGFIAPTDAQTLAGTVADLQAAFGGKLNFTTVGGAPVNSTPQSQIASTLAAIIANANAEFLAITNGMDPVYASGRMQDGIGRIFGLARIPDQLTVVSCVCLGRDGVIIPIGTQAQDESGNIYRASASGTIVGGTVTIPFTNRVTGPIACPANTLNKVYQFVSGWDSINNPSDGAVGRNVESRSEFEVRRQATIFGNSRGFVESIGGALLEVDNVLDAYVTDNDTSLPKMITPQCVFLGHTSGTTLIVDSITTGAIQPGQRIIAEDGSLAGTVTVLSYASANHWTLSASSSLTIRTFTSGGPVLAANSIYAAVLGGISTEVATAIWSKKPPGIPYTGNTTETVYDTSPQYSPPGIPLRRDVADTDFDYYFHVSDDEDSSLVPSDATAQIRAAVARAFAGTDGQDRMRIGQTVFASRFYAGIIALGPWAKIVDILITSINTPRVSFVGSIATTGGGRLTVTSITDGNLLTEDDIIAGAGVTPNTLLGNQLSGSTGSTGTYDVSVSQTVASESLWTVLPIYYTVDLTASQYPVISDEDIQVIYP